MALENPWGARRIHAELAKLGIEVSLATVSRYLPKRPPDPVRRQSWLTFLRNHKGGIAAMDFFVVPMAYYNAERVHTALGDSPNGRPSETPPAPSAKVVALPRVGGLHHRYAWCEAA
jgi:hypothetical protein